MKFFSTLWAEIKFVLMAYILPIAVITIVGLCMDMSEKNVDTLYSSIGMILSLIISVLYLKKKGLNCKEAFAVPDLKILLLAMVFMFCWAVFATLFFGIIFHSSEETYETSLLSSISTFTIVPIVEEIITRYGCINIGKKKVSLVCSTFISILIFTVLHFPTLSAACSIIGAATFFALIYNATGNLVYSICAHALNNFFGTIGYFIIEPFMQSETIQDLVNPFFIGAVTGLIISAILLFIYIKKKNTGNSDNIQIDEMHSV